MSCNVSVNITMYLMTYIVNRDDILP